MPGSAVRLPYHQPEKKDLSVFLARTEMKQQKFVGTSRLSWKQFVPPSSYFAPTSSSVAHMDGSLSADAVSSEMVTCTLAPESSTDVVAEAVVEQHLEGNALSDLNVLSSVSETVPSHIITIRADVTDTQEQLSSRTVQRKLLLLSPAKSTHAASEPLRNNLQEHSENSREQVEMLLAPAIGKKLLLDPMDTNKFNPSVSNVTETVDSEAVEDSAAENRMSEYIVEDLKDEDDVTSAKISSRVSRRVLPSNTPSPQLSGNPNDFIELDDNDGDYEEMNANDQGVEQLMERLLQHARGSSARRRKPPKTVEIRYCVAQLTQILSHY